MQRIAGYILLELIIALAIISIMILLASPTYSFIRDKIVDFENKIKNNILIQKTSL